MIDPPPRVLGPLALAPDVYYGRLTVYDDYEYCDQFVFEFARGVTDISGTQLFAMRKYVLPLLEAPGAYAEFYGLADRVGDRRFNLMVSKDRLQNFQLALFAMGALPRVVFGPQHKYLGEDEAEAEGLPNEVPDRLHRIVEAFIWPSFDASWVWAHDPVVMYGRSHQQPTG